MNFNENRSFEDNKQVQGMKLPEYLDWATENRKHEKPLKLPPIQRGFVWKPKQIVDLWDSLLRGMPIGSMMVTKLTGIGCDLTTRKTEEVNNEAIGLLDGQQRTLAMMIGWPFSNSDQHCLWIDLAEKGHAGSPFKIRLTTITQPFGFDHITCNKLSRHERKLARERFDNKSRERGNEEYLSKPDYQLFELDAAEQPRPWKADCKIDLFVKVKDLWQAFRSSDKSESAFLDSINSTLNSSESIVNLRLRNLYEAFTRLEALEVPLILVPEHISISKLEASANGATDPLVLLFERIGRNGASLSAEDLLFSMIKQQWPQAQDLVNKIYSEISVKVFMGATDYVMTAFRLAAAQKISNQGTPIADIPRPDPNDFHRHLSSLLRKEGGQDGPLSEYLKENSLLVEAFKKLFEVLKFEDSNSQDIGLPSLMMPHLSRGLIQVLLRWIMLNFDQLNIEINRNKIISFALFWYLNIRHEDKASKMAFEVINDINDSEKGIFPATKLYNRLTDSPEGEVGLALPLMSYKELEKILNRGDSALLQSYDVIFKQSSGKFDATFAQRELYKRFCWGRKPVLLWLQRTYIHQEFSQDSLANFAGFTDEDTVPYDYDHLCPQNHWGTDWRNIIKIPDESSPLMNSFRENRYGVSNCIGNLHILESGLNRSFGDAPLVSKLKEEGESKKWCHRDSLLYHCDEHEKLWETASPVADDENDKKKNQIWNEIRLQAFQSAVYRRAKGLYRQYYEACEHITK